MVSSSDTLITNLVTAIKNLIPSKTSDLTNDGDGTNVFVKNNDSRLSDARAPTSHNHTEAFTMDSLNIYQDDGDGAIEYAEGTLVYDSIGTKIDGENVGLFANNIFLYNPLTDQYIPVEDLATLGDIPSIPSAGSAPPLADTANGSYGSGTYYARDNHSHPKSSLYAEASHSHTVSNITNFPSIPSKTSDLTNDGDGTNAFLTSHQSLEPVEVYNCTSWNTTYTDSTATRRLTLYKLGPIYLLRYFMTTKTLTYASTSYNMNNDTIPSDYRPNGDRTFNIATSSAHTAKLTITSGGKIQISADTNSLAISFSGTVVWWW